ncbi:MAG: N-(5'-phosphoribosyl)anthranilate isomerase [Hyphococcus sp.]|nr:MAG: N-(5'-phosphoribosyl)anthranilate isomerase [Marinicaulis sp.]
MTTKFKICCIRSTEEADLAIAAGATAIGLVGAMPSGPGPLCDDKIRDIIAHVQSKYGPEIWTVLLTSRTKAKAIVDHIQLTGANSVQIVDRPEVNAYSVIREALPDLRLIQVLHVENEACVAQAKELAQKVDYLLLDSGKPSAAVKTLGGTGDVHDWSISRRVVEAVDIPVFLEGGLNPQNVSEAAALVQPYGVDVCSGLRDKQDDNRLIPSRLNEFTAKL